MIPVDDYVAFLEKEYLRDYVNRGGAAVKFAVAGTQDEADACIAALARAGREAGFVVAAVDAAATRVHLLEQVFFAVARQLDWEDLAANATLGAVESAGYPVGEGGLALDRLALDHQVEPRELRRLLKRELEDRVGRDFEMVSEFRMAMLRLCEAALQGGLVSEAEQAAVLEWLRGDLRRIASLRSALIFRRIGRHNARGLLFSLAHWLSCNGHAGLVLVLDLRRLGIARRSLLGDPPGCYYARSALLDSYEVLRQLVDNTDKMRNCMVVAVAAPEFLTDEARGVEAYQALKLRIVDEVRDARRDNPHSSLVRLGAG